MRTLTLSMALSTLLFASAPARGQGEEAKIPRPLPLMEDVKTLPAPSLLPPTEPPTERTRRIERPTTARPAGHGFLAGFECRVYVDEPGEGAIWAAGDTYKARFDASGATYVPFFGSAAPRSFPVGFRIAEIRAGTESIPFDADASPSRDGERIEFDRGAVRETWDLRTDSVEQSFVLERPIGGGDLVVELSVETDLERAEDAEGLVLRSDLGFVRYGRAVAIDARGERSDAPTTWLGDRIEIRVPAERVAAARWPLVIDPVIWTFAVDTSSDDHVLPEVACDATTLRNLVVYERNFSATDHDVYSSLINMFGSQFGFAYIDVTTDYWALPRVANNNIADQFLVVAQVGAPTGGARIIRGRIRSATGSGAVGAQFTISGPESGDKVGADVGGDPYLQPPTYYCVVWNRYFSSSDHDVHGRLVASSGSLVGPATILIDNSVALDDQPSVSKSDGPGPSSLQRWNLAWTRRAGGADTDIYGARIAWDGVISSPTFPIQTGSARVFEPSASSSTSDASRRWVVSYINDSTFVGGDRNTFVNLLEFSTVLDVLYLGASGPDEFWPVADCGGRQFAVATSVAAFAGSTNYNVAIDTLSIVGNQLGWSGGALLGNTAEPEFNVELATTGSAGGNERWVAAAWQRDVTPTNSDIQGAWYSMDPFTRFCMPGLSCPCGNNGSYGCRNSWDATGGLLDATGDADTPGSVVLHAYGMLPTATCIFLQGNSLVDPGTAFGDGVRCVAGTLKRLYVKTASGGTASAPGSGDPSITAQSAALGDTIAAGTKRWYQVYYRDPADFGCAAPATFNITSGIQIDW